MTGPASSSTPAPPPSSKPARTSPGFGRWMGSMWLYTSLRFGLFFALWGLLELLGLHGFLSAVLALVLSVPLSLLLLARPRAMFAQQLEARVDARRAERWQLDAELDPEAGSAGDRPTRRRTQCGSTPKDRDNPHWWAPAQVTRLGA